MRPIPFIFTILFLAFIQVSQAISQATAKNALKVHNQYRKLHGAPALRWNSTLESYAQKWSNKCKFQHTQGPYGENLAWGYGNYPAAIKAWYNEEKQYNYNNPGFTAGTGHFTAMVWKSTTDVGCGIKKCDGGAPMYTCSYWPAGNIVSADNAYFKANVLPPK
ncbi:CAP domain-containing protein [Phascolomyces articulosus]|uniref:Golgi-associated plant pathogenesis-related protein 1 n=1 Tax=Phascolomyces articulosus TaxID=60185 RepID=A0AAD5P8A5_9FUNG|nr:CAP domain-containing protein [Phascolomyces articulosus]